MLARLLILPALAAALALAACEESEGGPYLAFEGGGFVFNYRLAEVFYGFNVKPLRRLPAGTVLEARFEDPAGGPPIVAGETVAGPQLSYSFRTPPLSGVVAGRDYRVEVRVLEPGGKELARYARSFRSELDQSVLPDRALTVGPGYHAPPDGARPAAKP